MYRNSSALIALALVSFACGAGEDPGANTLNATWTFASGDCASNDVETVRVVASMDGGDALEGEFACTDDRGELGEISEEGGSYGIKAEGLDADGVVRAENFGQTATFPDGRTIGPVEITLHPKAADVVVSWNGCPGSTVLPYFTSLYEPPSEDSQEEFGEKVTEVQESCASSQATLMDVAPGDYIVEVDSRAVTPAVRGTEPVTVIAGEDLDVFIDVP